MAQLSANHVTYAFVAKNIARQATTITNPASMTYIKEGEVVVSGLNNKLITDAAETYTGVKNIKISQLKNTGLYSSPTLNYDNITFYKVTAHASKVQKVIYVGFNGTSGCLENNSFLAGQQYEIRVKKLDLIDHYEDTYNTHKLFSYYNESVSTAQSTIARKLVKNGVNNFYNDIDGFVKVEMVTNSATTAASAAVDFIEGSKVAIAAGTHGIVAGKFIKVNTTETYYVTSVNGNSIYLEVPYQGTSCTCTPTIVTTATIGDWGIKLSGNEKIFDAENNKFTYNVTDFDIVIPGFTDTPITYASYASLGNGEWEEVAQMEWEVQDYDGQTSHTDHLMPSRKRYFEQGIDYDILVIKGFDDSTTQISGTPKSLFTVYVAIPVTNTQGDDSGANPTNMGVATALDTWLTANTSTTYTEASNLT